ncbi:MAG: fibronectin type III domain-containing protein [Nitrospira sp.]|nr:fibronectin type III domain-containing protein [Nitrospira sp.]
MRLVSSVLIITSCFLFVFSFTACGRRGDPVPIAPYDENIVKEDAKKDQARLPVEEGTANRKSSAVMPDAPTGLMALYTQKYIILTWDDNMGRDVKRYNIYRSSGDGYIFVGDTAAPAFTDREVEPDTEYYYKVTAVEILESQPSKEIVIVTEIH